VSGAVARALNLRHRPIVDELCLLTGLLTARYESSSGFRSVFDRSDVAAVEESSAVAHALDLFIKEARGQRLEVPNLRGEPESGTGLVEGDPAPATGLDQLELDGMDQVGGGLRSGGRLGAGGRGAVLAVLELPAATAARERVELARRALDNGWYHEAERLFFSATALVPTEPLLWFGAGIAAANGDDDGDLARASRHLERAGRYLQPVDPSGSTYVVLLASALAEQSGHLDRARGLLRQQARDLAAPCPALSVHLARLGSKARHHIDKALTHDPLLEADVAALGLIDNMLLDDGRRRIEDELATLDHCIDELRTLNDGLGRSDPPPAADPDPGDGSLVLVELEVALWRKLGVAESELAEARRGIQGRVEARNAKEQQVSALTQLADADLGHAVAVRFAQSAVGIALVMLGWFVAGRLAAEHLGPLAAAVAMLSWLAQLALVMRAVRLFVRAWWPCRSYRRARLAKAALPRLTTEATSLRRGEFEARRQYRLVSCDTRSRMQRVADRRRSVVPQRPTFDHLTAGGS